MNEQLPLSQRLLRKSDKSSDDLSRIVQDLMHTRAVLRTLGFTEELGYKRDVGTRNGRTGPDEWYLRV